MAASTSWSQDKEDTVQGGELNSDLGEYKDTLPNTRLSSLTNEVSHLSSRDLLYEARVIAIIPTKVKPRYRVSCGRINEAWISGRENAIRRVDLNGCELESIPTTCTAYHGEISVTRQGDLIYSDSGNEIVNVVRGGKTEVLFTTPQSWKPHTLCCTRSGDILVCVCRDKLNKILRYEGNIMTEEIDNDGIMISRAGDRINFVSVNNNGDICVSDGNVDIVVVVDKTRKVRFRYDGTPARRKKKISPRHIVTDSNSHIIVADYNNACLHILDQDGHFLSCVDGLDQPTSNGMSVDSEGRLWVGVASSGDVKVIQHIK